MTQESKETDFAENLALEGLLNHGSLEEKKAWLDEHEEEEKEEEAEAEAEKKADPFDDPAPKKRVQRNWLEHGLTETVSMKKAKRGRKAGGTNQSGMTRARATKEAIQIMTSLGVTKPVMAKMLGLSLKKLNKDFEHELEYGKDMLTTRITSALIQKALHGNVTAQMFFLKTKAGFRETDKTDVPDAERLALSGVERNQRLMSLLMTNPEFKVMMGQKLLESKPIDITPEADKDVFDI